MTPSLHNEIVRRYYGTTAGRGHRASKEYYEEAADGLMRRLRPWLPRDHNQRCLDLACGCGEMLYLLEREGFKNSVGVNLCKEEIDQARPYVKSDLVHADACEYLSQCEAGSFDFITALNFLEHLSKDKLLSVLREIKRTLKPGGVLVAMVPNAISPFGGLTRYWDITHEWAFTPNNFFQLAALAGFEPRIECRECGPVPHGLVSGVRYALWQMIRLAIASWLLIEVADRKGGVYTMDMLVRLRSPALGKDG